MNDGGYREEVRISGSGKIAGGRYGKISIGGSGRVEGDVEANKVTAAGSAVFDGDLTCEEIIVTGSCRISGRLETDRIVSRGSLTVKLGLETKEIKSYGSLKIGGDLKSDAVYFAGSSEIEGDVEAENFVSRGSFEIDGLLTADDIDIWLGSANSAEEVGGSNIEIRKKSVSLTPDPDSVRHGIENLESRLDKLGEKLGFSLELDEEKISSGVTNFGDKITEYINDIGTGEFKSSLIEGDELDLESVKANTVRGRNVRIREGCVIDKVEYSDTIKVEAGASVGEQLGL